MANFPVLDERWSYQSFCPRPGAGERAPQLAVPWSPRGELTVKADPETGKVSGHLVFSPKVQLTVTGTLIGARDELPDGIELTAQGLDSVSSLRGYFVHGATTCIAGIIVALRNDPAQQPIGTRGAFVLYPGPADRIP